MLDNELTGDGSDLAAAPTDSPAVKKAAKKSTTAKKAAKKTTKKAAAKKSTAKKAAASAASADAPSVTKTAKKSVAKKAAAKKTAKKATPAADDAAATGDDAAEAPARKRASRKKAVVPAFTATEEAAAVEAAVAAEAPIPGVMFQAPDPDAAPVRKRAARKKAAPAAADAAETDASMDELDDAGAAAGAETDSDDGEGEGSRRRRRRRGGRGRRGRTGGDDSGDGEATTDTDADAATEGQDSDESDDAEGSGTSRRRRRRRRQGDGDDNVSDDPPNTVTKVRTKKAAKSDEPQGIKGSVRIEAKRQRRREGREAGRRRPPVLTEAEFLARREAVERVMVVRQIGDRTQIAVLEDDVLVEHHVSRETTGSMIGNVYLGRVQNVLPSMEAAFIDIGRGRNAVLYAGEVNWDAAGLEGQPKRIEVALKSGDSVLVQVTKDPVGHKGARLTSQISLPGRYLVYVPDGSMTGISRKLPDTERSRLKSILKRVLPENAGVIVRTASEGASEDELSRDVARLAAQWDDIDAKRGTANAPALLYGEPDLTVRVIRDIFNEDFSKLIVSGAAAWDTVNDYIGHVAPDLHDRVEKWTSDKDVWSELRIDEQLAKALDRKVWLPSGGSLVIDRTEAMTVIDINTGKFTGQGGNLEQTVTENNLEAAEEIVRQLRLRDIGGIIVIDFIDMVLESNRDLVLRRLVECLGRDRTKHQVAEVTSLGLVQMTRKRVGEGLFEVFSSTCDSCNGRGVHVHMEPVEGKRGTGKSAGDSRGDGRSDTSKQRGKGKGKGKSDDVAPTTSAAPDDSAADDRGTADGEGGRKRRRGRRGGTDSAGAAQDEAASPEVTSTVATSSDTVDEAPSGTEGADTPGDATSAVPAAAGPVETPEAPVFAPRGIDLTPEPASTPGPKRRRRGASRPAGAPTTD